MSFHYLFKKKRGGIFCRLVCFVIYFPFFPVCFIMARGSGEGGGQTWMSVHEGYMIVFYYFIFQQLSFWVELSTESGSGSSYKRFVVLCLYGDL